MGFGYQVEIPLPLTIYGIVFLVFIFFLFCFLLNVIPNPLSEQSDLVSLARLKVKCFHTQGTSI